VEHPLVLMHIKGIPDHIVMTWFVMLCMLIFGIILKNKIQTVPTGLQLVAEGLIVPVQKMLTDVMDEKGKKYMPLVGAVALFILTGNFLSLFPGFVPPTANVNTNAAVALVVFIAYNYIGIKEHGVSYFKHFAGPMPALAPLMVPIEILSHLARPLSLTLRLFGNMMGHELVLGILLLLVPYFFPGILFIMSLGVLVVFIQAFVFTLLTVIYIAGAVESGEH